MLKVIKLAHKYPYRSEGFVGFVTVNRKKRRLIVASDESFKCREIFVQKIRQNLAIKWLNKIGRHKAGSAFIRRIQYIPCYAPYFKGKFRYVYCLHKNSIANARHFMTFGLPVINAIERFYGFKTKTTAELGCDSEGNPYLFVEADRAWVSIPYMPYIHTLLFKQLAYTSVPGEWSSAKKLSFLDMQSNSRGLLGLYAGHIQSRPTMQMFHKLCKLYHNPVTDNHMLLTYCPVISIGKNELDNYSDGEVGFIMERMCRSLMDLGPELLCKYLRSEGHKSFLDDIKGHIRQAKTSRSAWERLFIKYVLEKAVYQEMRAHNHNYSTWTEGNDGTSTIN